MPKYNHAYDIAFSLENDSPEGYTNATEVRQAILKRLASMPDYELLEAIGAPFDTYEVVES